MDELVNFVGVQTCQTLMMETNFISETSADFNNLIWLSA
jgi:hypothetical protein